MNPGHSRILHLKGRWEEEDAARDALELRARREFLEQDANEIFTSMETYFTRLAKIIRVTGASVEIDENWEHIRDQKLRRTTKVIGQATTSSQSYCARCEHFLPRQILPHSSRN
jgi:predicted ABC-class ATPase